MHSIARRQRVYDFMKEEADELDRLDENERKMGRAVPKDERIQRPSQSDEAVIQVPTKPGGLRAGECQK